jgi:hypothetical protein
MLVDMGDLPQPDNNVLSETLWNSEHSAAAPSSVPNAGAGVHGMHSGPMPSIVTRPVGTYSTVYCPSVVWCGVVWCGVVWFLLFIEQICIMKYTVRSNNSPINYL